MIVSFLAFNKDIQDAVDRSSWITPLGDTTNMTIALICFAALMFTLWAVARGIWLKPKENGA